MCANDKNTSLIYNRQSLYNTLLVHLLFAFLQVLDVMHEVNTNRKTPTFQHDINNDRKNVRPRKNSFHIQGVMICKFFMFIEKRLTICRGTTKILQ